ncbi:MAG: hypothetical protein M1823_001866 [Watsoniomyces obsoletus]|nr:MAG: hypothetical protein M1823_001866 [Watsoniomyces obsoletus]
MAAVANKSFLASIDQGTTSSRFIIFDTNGAVIASHQVELSQKHPRPGWHEHDPQELFNSVQLCMEKASQQFIDLGHNLSDIKAVGLTNQRETTLVWDSNTGEPLHDAIAWPDTRTAALVRELKERPGASELQDICGLPLSTYPSSVKLVWLLRNVDGVRNAYDEGRLTFGTVDTWLLFQLNGGNDAGVLVTDVSNASRTMLLNLETLQYDDRLLDFFGLDRNKIQLPKVVPCSDPDVFGRVASGPFKGISIAACLGDQSAAMVGQCCFEPGMAKNTYGTGCFLLQHVGNRPVRSKHNLLATVAYHFGHGHEPQYALEGSIATAGSAVRFLSSNLGFFESSQDIDRVASTVPDNGGVVFVTAFSGLFAPYWIDDIKGTIFGITQHTQQGHIARATLEATCFQTKAIFDAMEQDSSHKLHIMAVDGGMSASDLCMQTQADILGVQVDRPVMRETTSLGAAIAAGFAVGIWKDFNEIKGLNREDRVQFHPQIPAEKRDAMFRRWERAVNMARGWVDHDIQ